MGRRMDPYVIVKLGGFVERTKTHNDAGKNPQWSDVMHLLLVVSHFQEEIRGGDYY